MEANKIICDLCCSSEINDVEFGQMMKLNDLNVHYFCVLLSSNTAQRGEDDEGIYGFLEEDIRESLRIAKRTLCYICNKTNASIYCRYYRECRRAFHFPCGYRNNCLSQFADKYPSYCHEHLPFDTDDEDEAVPCFICMDMIVDMHPLLRVPTCCKEYRFHRKCMLEAALNAGYLTKCMGCHRRTDKYTQMLRERGIFVPDRDATWERAPIGALDAFPELLFRPNTCTASACRCPDGRRFLVKHRSRESRWNIISCRVCGSKGAHRLCSSGPPFYCGDCEKHRSMFESNERRVNERSITIRSDESEQSSGYEADDAFSGGYTTEDSVDEEWEDPPDEKIELSDSDDDCQEVPYHPAIGESSKEIDIDESRQTLRDIHEAMCAAIGRMSNATEAIIEIISSDDHEERMTNLPMDGSQAGTGIVQIDISDGESVIVCDSDSDGDARAEPPLTIVAVKTEIHENNSINAPDSRQQPNSSSMTPYILHLSDYDSDEINNETFIFNLRRRVNLHRRPSRAARKITYDPSYIISDDE